MIVDTAVYRKGVRVHSDAYATEDLRSARKHITGPDDFVWVGLAHPSEDELAEAEDAFGLHPLAIEDALQAHQRPKLERYGDSLFLVLKTLWYVDERDAVETGEILVFVGKDFVVSVRHGRGSELHEARLRLESNPRELLHGPSAVVYTICDAVVDGYSGVIADLVYDVDEVEGSVFSDRRTSDSARIYTLKRELAEVRRAVMPLKEPLRRMSEGGVDLLSAGSAPFFRDVADHLIRDAETVDELDGLLSSAFDAHMAAISIQQNDDMRKISAGAALVVVPTLIAGVYGMNFHHMPELAWRFGYPMAVAMMIAVAVGLWILFKRSGWL